MSQIESINDNEFLRQYETTVNQEMAFIEYSLQDRKIFLTKLVIPEALESDDFTHDFIKQTLESIKERNLSVVPTAIAIIKFIRKNKQYKSMLPVGLKI